MSDKDKLTAQRFLTQLNIGPAQDTRFITDPVTLLGEQAVLMYRGLKQIEVKQERHLEQLRELAKAQTPQGGVPAEQSRCDELARGILAVDGLLTLASKRSDGKQTLTVPLTGVANVMVIRGDMPSDVRPHADGTVVLQLGAADELVVRGGDDDVLLVPLEAAKYRVDVRAYTVQSPGPDLIVRLTPTREANVAAVFKSH